MTALRTRAGQEVQISDWHGDTPETLERVLAADVVLDDLEEADADVEPEAFADDVAKYVAETFRVKQAPAVRFETKGRVGDVAYWVFSAEPIAGEPVFAMLVRNEAISELVCVSAEMESGGTLRRLTAAQAALWDFCVTDYRRPNA
ncbi:MAG: hypothetical protein KF858_11025 [Candidatus Sumerlaeia bacterium]|nr:hypothetical protein [Candidatus Sumerlaeia bacterium]